MQDQSIPIDRLPLFAGLSPTEIAALRQALRVQRFRVGTSIVAIETLGDGLYIILSGTVKVCVHRPDGDEVIIAMLGPGELVGELSVLDSNVRSADVVTQEDSTLAWMDRAAFDQLLQTNAAVAANLLPILSRRIRMSTEQILALCSLDVYGKVARQLLVFARQYGERGPAGITIPLRLTQTDIAGLVGASRERVNRAVGGLRQRKLIDIDAHHRITVLDMEKLERIVASR